MNPKLVQTLIAAHSVPAPELMIMPDGRILAHNLTPSLARVLAQLDPTDAAMKKRAALSRPPGTRKG